MTINPCFFDWLFDPCAVDWRSDSLRHTISSGKVHALLLQTDDIQRIQRLNREDELYYDFNGGF